MRACNKAIKVARTWPTSTAARSCTAAIWPRRSATAPCSRLRLSMCACNKAIKVARTLADLDSGEELHSRHLAEALSYRSL